MTVIRTIKDKAHPFTMVPDAAINDERLSIGAIGLLVWCLCKPDDWVFNASEIKSEIKMDSKKLRLIISELIECGYFAENESKH